jgi:O-antigen/teichoic acid export membrane protein
MLKVIAGNFSVKFFSAMANLLIAIIISQSLGAAGKGEQSIILATITVILLVTNLVGGASIVYLTSRIGTKNILITSYIWTFIVVILCYFFLESIPYVSTKYNLAISFLSGINSMASINSSILIGKEKIQKSNLINLCIPVLTLVSIGNFFYCQRSLSITSYLISLFVSYFSALSIGVFFLLSERSETKDYCLQDFQSTFKALIFFGFQNQLAHIFQLLSFRLSYFLLAAHSGQKAVGIYSNGLSIVESIWMISSSISLYQYARISNSDNSDYAKKLTEQCTKSGLLLTLFALMMVLALPTNFFTWLFGPEFHEIKLLILIMAPGIWIFNYALIIGHYFSGIGKYFVNAIASFGGFLVTLILLLLFSDKLTIYYAGIIAVASYFVTSMIVIIFYWKEGGKFVVLPSFNEVRKSFAFLLKSKENQLLDEQT